MIDNYLLFIQEFDYDNFLEENEILLEKIDLTKLKSSFKKHLDIGEKILKKHKIPVNELKKTGKKIAKDIVAGYKKNIAPDKVAKKIQSEIVKKVRKVAPKESLSLPKKVVIALIAIMVVIMVQISLMATIAMVFGGILGMSPVIAGSISAIILAPVTEEALKAYFIEMKMPWVGTGLFAGQEALLYIFTMVMAGMSFPMALLIRGLAVAMHFLTTYIQTKIRTKFPMEEQKEKGKFLGFLAGVGLHATWNAIAVLTS